MNIKEIEKQFKYKEYANLDWNDWNLYQYKIDLFTFQFIENFKDKINWNELTYELLRHKKITQKIVKTFSDYLNWEDISFYNMNYVNDILNFLLQNKDKFNLYEISKNDSIPKDIRQNFFNIISKEKNIDKETLIKNFQYKNYMYEQFNWDQQEIYSYKEFTQDNWFLEKFKDKINWKTLTKELNENNYYKDFIQKWKDYIDWKIFIVGNPKLRLSFIEKYQSYLDWNFVSAYTDLSINTIKKYKNKINWKIYFRNKSKCLNTMSKDEWIKFLGKEQVNEFKKYLENIQF